MSDTLRLSNTETCFPVLINVIKQGNVDSFAVALLDMKQLVLRSTTPLLFWREDVFNGIMCLDREDDRLEK